MSDINKAREALNTCGYQHPETLNKKSDKIYKTFNPGTDSKDPYVKPSKTSVYATFTEKDTKFNCPECGDKALYSCNCQYKDKACKNNHIWFTDLDGTIRNGDPHDTV